MGYYKTLHKSKLDFFLKEMCKDLKQVVRECYVYQVNKSKAMLLIGLLQSLLIPQQPWI